MTKKPDGLLDLCDLADVFRLGQRTENVHHQDNALKNRQALRAEGVHERANKSDGNHQEGLVPALLDVVGVVEGGHGQDQDRGRVGGRCDQSLPAERCEPTDNVGEELLLGSEGTVS